MLRMYDFKCRCCGALVELIVDSGEHPLCDWCGGSLERMPPLVRINMGPAGAYGYYDETLQTYVGTNRERRKLCREFGVTPKGDTPKPDGEAWV